MDIFAPIGTGERIDAAARLIVAGRMDEADVVLKEILAREPGNPDALSTLASIPLAAGDGEKAMAILGPACTAYPNHPKLLSNLGLAHFVLGRPDDAVVCLQRAVANAPENVEIRLGLSQYLMASGKLQAAAEEIDRILRDEPGHAAALAQRGAAFIALGDLRQAEAAFRAAAAASPDDADILGNLSSLCAMMGRHVEAEALAERAHLRAPLDIAKQLQLARCRAMLGDFDGAAALCKRILVVATESLQTTELFARVNVARGAVESGIATMTQFVRRRSQDADAILSLAGVLRFAGRFDQALAFVDQALAIAPDHSHGRMMRTDLLLTLGRFAEAWPVSSTQDDRPRVVSIPRGTNLTDAILYGRFLQRVDPAGVTLVCDGPCVGMPALQTMRGVLPSREVAAGEARVSMMHLPHLLGIDRDTVSMQAPYLQPDPVLVDRWRVALAPIPRPWIGVIWDAFPPGLLLKDVAPVIEAAGTPISLMTGADRPQLREWRKAIDAGVQIKTAADLVAAVSCLDAIVSTDDAALHAAGALALPGVAVASVGHPWYLLADENRSVLYPSLAVLTQEKPGRWDDVLARLPDLLRLVLAERENAS